MTKEEFYRNIAYYNNRIDCCNSIALLNEIYLEFRKYTLLFFNNSELYKMQVPFNVEFYAVNMRVAERYLELRKENGIEEIED